jgi:type I restriction enzyme S subunit
MSGRYQAYPEYKDSDVEWFGLVPTAWNSSRLKFESAINMGQSPNSDDCNQDGIGLPFLQGNAEFGIISPSPKQFCGVSRKVSQKGDLLFSVRAPVGALNFSDQKYGIGRGLCAISNSESLAPKFLWWLIPIVKSELDSVSTGSTFEAVSAEQVENVVLYKPSIMEQQKIAKFLDHETAKIDTLIEKQQQLIKLLKEKRQAVISHAVTKGINPNAPMHDSGVEWLGEVPEHWDVMRLSRVGKVGQGCAFSHSIQGQEIGELPWFKCMDMNTSGNEKLMNNAANYIDYDLAERIGAPVFPTGAVIFPRVGAALLTNKRRVLSCPSVVDDNIYTFVPVKEKVHSRFIYFFLQLIDMATICSPGLVPTITFGAVNNIR